MVTMSTRISLSFKGLATVLGGFVLAVSGILLLVNSSAADPGSLNLWFFTPLALGLVLVGAVMLVSRDT
jgi:hypothetical protein